MHRALKKGSVLALVVIAAQAGGVAFLACSADDSSTTPPHDSGTDRRDTGPAPDTGADAGPSRAIYALDDQNALLRFMSTTPETVTTLGTVSGPPAVHAIDFRPSNRELYALGSDGKIYTINLVSAAATALDSTADGGRPTFDVPPLDPAADSFGFDFNPAADAIRIHAITGQNLRLEPANGRSLKNGGDVPLAYGDAGTDAGALRVIASAYTNSVSTRPTMTTLYGIDSESGRLVSFSGPPDFATATASSGSLGVRIEKLGGFDIYGGTCGQCDAGRRIDEPLEPYAALQVGATTSLYRIDLQTGSATALGAIGHSRPLRGIAVQPPPPPPPPLP